MSINPAINVDVEYFASIREVSVEHCIVSVEHCIVSVEHCIVYIWKVSWQSCGWGAAI